MNGLGKGGHFKNGFGSDSACKQVKESKYLIVGTNWMEILRKFCPLLDNTKVLLETVSINVVNASVK